MAVALQLREIRGQAAGPRVLIVGGVHGDEFEPMRAIRELAAQLEPHRLRGSVTLIAVVNEPAFRLGQRTAQDGLDLARTCPGREDGTITEQVAAALSRQIRAADYFIDLHTGGTKLSVLPLVGYVLHPDPRVLDTQRRMASAFGLPLIWGTDHRLEGRSLSVARDANVPAVYAEYHGGGRCDAQGVTAYVQGCRNVLSELGLLDEPRPRPTNAPRIIEDPRPHSGHMQINLPAPSEGFFQPVVELGQVVRRGELLGTVSDVLGDRVLEVRSPHAGLVVVLHTFARVDAGESLGVVVEGE